MKNKHLTAIVAAFCPAEVRLKTRPTEFN